MNLFLNKKINESELTDKILKKKFEKFDCIFIAEIFIEKNCEERGFVYY